MSKTRFTSVLATFVVCFLFWILITWSFDGQELIAGAVISLGVALFAARFFIHTGTMRMANPLRFLSLVWYCCVVFLWELIKANWDMAKRALDEENPDLATSVLAKDNLLDDINSAVTPILADYLGEHPDDRLTCLNLVSVFRKLERAGDHITNMAEEIIFFVNAKVLKHQGNTDEHYI